jgi:hypothetical protein
MSCIECLKISKDLDEKLIALKSESYHILKYSEMAVDSCKSALLEMRNIVFKNGFDNQKDEIEFFKNIKPKIYGNLIYYTNIFSVETTRPKSSIEVQQKYLIFELDKIQTYFHDNLEFYQYFLCQTTNLDDHYFVREMAEIRPSIGSLYFLIDPIFSTSHDHTVAVITAYNMLSVYLNKELEKLDSKCEKCDNIENEEGDIFDFEFYWTDSKVALIEMIYGIHSTKAINHGNIDIKVLVKVFEKLLHIDLGDIYHAFAEMRLRKKDRTKFIDYLKNRLLGRMDDSDQ